MSEAAPQNFRGRVWRNFRRDRLAVACLALLAILAVLAILFFAFGRAEVHWPYDPNLPQLEAKLQSPRASHWLGTDNLGRDVLTRMLHGTYISLTIGFVAVGVSLLIGVTVGAVAGYFGGWVDSVLMRMVDAIMCFPSFFLILTVVAILGPNIWNVVLVIGLVSWTGTARLVRAEFLTLRETQYVAAARAVGQKHGSIMFRHILPNAAAPILVTAVLGIPDAILTEAGLSFLGFGVQPPQPTWGNIIADGKTYILDAWWLILFPGIAILVTTLAFYLAGDALREATDTRKGS
ncbi:MAG: ABC transporter permease [Verrucomicrobiae bacterium]|nr:ABC transporter permease [Verrucomicrobiae bacterium]